MACWINLSPLCVALTRQSSGFMADWICVIKDDKQNHLLVTSICHRPAFTISHTSLKNNSKSSREGWRKRGEPYATTPQREREREKKRGGWGEEKGWGAEETGRCKDESRRVRVKVNEGARVRRQSTGWWREGQTKKKKRKRQMEVFCCPTLSQPVEVSLLCPTDCLMVTESALPAPTSQRSNLTSALFLLSLPVKLSSALL